MGRRALILCLAGFALAFPAAASARPPVITTIPFPDFVDTETCSFPIALHFEGTVTAHIFFDKNGTVVKEIDIFGNFTVTFTNTTNEEKSLSTRGPAPSIITFTDGSPNTLAIVGLNAAITVPGVGLVALDAGRIVFGQNGAITFEAGNHVFFGSGDASKFCAVLGDP